MGPPCVAWKEARPRSANFRSKSQTSRSFQSKSAAAEALERATEKASCLLRPLHPRHRQAAQVTKVLNKKDAKESAAVSMRPLNIYGIGDFFSAWKEMRAARAEALASWEAAGATGMGSQISMNPTSSSKKAGHQAGHQPTGRPPILIPGGLGWYYAQPEIDELRIAAWLESNCDPSERALRKLLRKPLAAFFSEIEKREQDAEAEADQVQPGMADESQGQADQDTSTNAKEEVEMKEEARDETEPMPFALVPRASDNSSRQDCAQRIAADDSEAICCRASSAAATAATAESIEQQHHHLLQLQQQPQSARSSRSSRSSQHSQNSRSSSLTGVAARSPSREMEMVNSALRLGLGPQEKIDEGDEGEDEESSGGGGGGGAAPSRLAAKALPAASAPPKQAPPPQPLNAAAAAAAAAASTQNNNTENSGQHLQEGGGGGGGGGGGSSARRRRLVQVKSRADLDEEQTVAGDVDVDDAAVEKEDKEDDIQGVQRQTDGEGREDEEQQEEPPPLCKAERQRLAREARVEKHIRTIRFLMKKVSHVRPPDAPVLIAAQTRIDRVLERARQRQERLSDASATASPDADAGASLGSYEAIGDADPDAHSSCLRPVASGARVRNDAVS